VTNCSFAAFFLLQLDRCWTRRKTYCVFDPLRIYVICARSRTCS